MKIIVNYDLLEKAKEAKYGFSLVKETKWSAKYCAFFYGAIWTPFYAITKDPIAFSQYLHSLPCDFLLCIPIIAGMRCCMDYFDGKDISAILDLFILSEKLGALNIDTNRMLLMNAYKYKTEYEINSDKKIPRLVQKKYINIPTTDDKEASLLQEHVVGTRTYTLSKGKPRKQMVFKPAFSN